MSNLLLLALMDSLSVSSSKNHFMVDIPMPLSESLTLKSKFYDAFYFMMFVTLCLFSKIIGHSSILCFRLNTITSFSKLYVVIVKRFITCRV